MSHLLVLVLVLDSRELVSVSVLVLLQLVLITTLVCARVTDVQFGSLRSHYTYFFAAFFSS